MLVADQSLYPKRWVSTLSTSSGEILLEKLFYDVKRTEQSSSNWLYKWVYTPIGDTGEYDIEVVLNN